MNIGNRIEMLRSNVITKSAPFAPSDREVERIKWLAKGVRDAIRILQQEEVPAGASAWKTQAIRRLEMRADYLRRLAEGDIE